MAEDLSSLRTNAGTPGFTAPEVLGFHSDDDSIESDGSEDESRLSYTKAVDIWAIGAISFLLLTGVIPFPSQNNRALSKYIRGRVSFPVERLRDKNVDVSGCALIENFMAPDPSNRPSADSSLQHSWLCNSQDTTLSNVSVSPSGVVLLAQSSSYASGTWTADDSGCQMVVPLAQGRNSTIILEEAQDADQTFELAVKVYDQKRYDEAEQLFRESAQQLEKELGAEHRRTLWSKAYIARTLFEQKKFNDAEQLFRISAQDRQKVLGVEHEDTLDSNLWLACVANEQGRYDEAERLVRELARHYAKVFGVEHKDTMDSNYWLALTIFQQKQYRKAEHLLRSSARQQGEVLGAEHEDTMCINFWLAYSVFEQKKYNDAKRLFRESARQRETVLGAEHKDTLLSKRLLEECRRRGRQKQSLSALPIRKMFNRRRAARPDPGRS